MIESEWYPVIRRVYPNQIHHVTISSLFRCFEFWPSSHVSPESECLGGRRARTAPCTERSWSRHSPIARPATETLGCLCQKQTGRSVVLVQVTKCTRSYNVGVGMHRRGWPSRFPGEGAS